MDCFFDVALAGGNNAAGYAGFGKPHRCSFGAVEVGAGTIRPWTAAEARGFLSVARPDPLYPAFVLLILYGLRRG